MLYTPPLSPLEAPVAAITFAGGSMPQTAQVKELVIRVLPDGCCTLEMTAQPVRHDSMGAPLPASISNPAPVVLVANRSCAVDPATGAPRYRLRTDTLPATPTHPATPGTAYNLLTQELETFAPGQDWPAFLHAKPETLMLQDRFFGLLCARADVNVSDLMLENLAQADATPSRFVPHV